jgi:hypothetical protein
LKVLLCGSSLTHLASWMDPRIYLWEERVGRTSRQTSAHSAVQQIWCSFIPPSAWLGILGYRSTGCTHLQIEKKGRSGRRDPILRWGWFLVLPCEMQYDAMWCLCTPSNGIGLLPRLAGQICPVHYKTSLRISQLVAVAYLDTRSYALSQV